MFDPTGHMRLAKSKSTPMKSLQVEIPTWAIESNVTVIDVSAVLWTDHRLACLWHSSVIHRSCEMYVAAKLNMMFIWISARYYDYSTKTAAQKDLFNSTSTELRLSTPTLRCLFSDQKQDATEQAHFNDTLADRSHNTINWYWLGKNPFQQPFLKDICILDFTWLPPMKSLLCLWR